LAKALRATIRATTLPLIDRIVARRNCRLPLGARHRIALNRVGKSTSDSTVYKPRSAAHPRICRALPGSDLKHRARPLAALPRPS
jgi:hypothetical protein